MVEGEQTRGTEQHTEKHATHKVIMETSISRSFIEYVYTYNIHFVCQINMSC